MDEFKIIQPSFYFPYSEMNIDSQENIELEVIYHKKGVLKIDDNYDYELRTTRVKPEYQCNYDFWMGRPESKNLHKK